jgi:hypothetical protein
MKLIKNLIGILQALRQLIAYLFLFTLFLNPVGVIFLYHLTQIRRNEKSMYIWLSLDRIAATLIHGTTHRTISGITGQYMSVKKRYKYQAMVIDFILGKNHCKHAYEWERSKGYL